MQRTNEWFEKDDKNYHSRQFKEPYRSTVAFCSWLEKIGYLTPDSTQKIIDIGTGQGANLLFMAKRYPKCTFVGVDINEDNIRVGNELLDAAGIDNCRLEVGNVYDLDQKHVDAYDGIVSLQTLSWLPGFEEPLERMFDLRGKWLALTSLFYDGPVSCEISVKHYDEALQQDYDNYYNIYSLPVVEKFLSARGFTKFQTTKFDIDIDLPKPASGRMTTYTEELTSGRRLQVSGPLLMPWHFVACTTADAS